MNIVKENILSPEILAQADAIGITTNGIIRKDGRAVMGAGVARAFRDYFPGIDNELAENIRKRGNVVSLLRDDARHRVFCHPAIFSFPTKHHWKDASTLSLIDVSAYQLKIMADDLGWEKVYLPRPGCSNGGLNWSDVRPILEPYFDERFYICHL